MEILEKIRKLMVNLEDLDMEELEKLIEKALEKHSATEVLEKALRPSMAEIGKKFERGEYFLAELVFAADIFKEVFNKYLRDKLASEKKAETLGKVVIGTIEGDVHDIGKTIVATLLEAAGFEVIDLGVDVPAEKFVEEAEKHGAQVIAISALLTTTMLNMGKVIKLLEEKGVRDKYIVIVGGAPVTEEFAKKIGANAYGKDAYDGVAKVKKLVYEKFGVKV